MPGPGDDRVDEPVSEPDESGPPTDSDAVSDHHSSADEETTGPESARSTRTNREAKIGSNNRAGDKATRHESRSAEGPGVSRRQQDSRQETGDDWGLFARDVVSSVLAVLLIGAYLFAISGVWPPMVAIESGSMEPNMEVNDLVFVMETDRFQPAEATGETGIVTATVGAESGYEQFGNSGDVIVFQPSGNGEQTPIIHRAMFWVEEGENWCQMADSEYLGGLDPSSQRCEAAHDGFITKGDRNSRYDQVGAGAAANPVKPAWVVGTAEIRIPGLGWLRLQFQ